MRLADLFEEVGAQTLYHGTPIDDAIAIIDTDRINGSTPHGAHRIIGARPGEIDQFGNVYGVSLTRSPWFARKWKSGEGVVLALDADRLRHRYRMLQVNYYQDRKESEEYVVGPITNLSRYLVGVIMSRETAEWCREADEDMGGHYQPLLGHPLLKIDGEKWHATTGMNIKGGGAPTP